MYWLYNGHKDYHWSGQPEPWLTGEVYRLLKARNAAFRAGDEEGLKIARANLSRGIREAKRQYSRRIAHRFSDGRDTLSLWQGIQTITVYKPPPQTCDSTISLLNELNSTSSWRTGEDAVPGQCEEIPQQDQCTQSPGSWQHSWACTERLCSGTHQCLHRHFQHLTKSGCCPHMLQSYHHHSSPEEVVSILLQWLPSSSTYSYSHEVLWTASHAVSHHIKSVLPPSLDPFQFAYRSNRSTDDAIATALHSALTHLDKKLVCQNAVHRLQFSIQHSAAEKIVGVSLPSLQKNYSTRLTRKPLCIAGDPTHPTHSFFSLLPSGRRLRSLQARTSRLKDSFIHQAVRKLNPPPPSSLLPHAPLNSDPLTPPFTCPYL